MRKLQYFKLVGGFGIMFAILGMMNLSVAEAQFLNFDTSPFERFFFKPQGETGIEQTTFVVERFVNIVRLAVGLIATFFAIVSALQLVLSQGDSGVYDKAKNTLLYSTIGIMIIALSPDLGRFFALTDGGLLGTRSDVQARLMIFDNGVRIVITFFKYLLTAVGTASLVYSGSKMVAQATNDDEVSRAKKNFGVTLGAMVALILSDGLVRRVFYRIDTPLNQPRIDLGQGMQELVGFINLIVAITGPIMILTLVAGGLMYAASGGNEETQGKARKMIGVSLLGIVLIYGSFAIVSTAITGRL